MSFKRITTWLAIGLLTGASSVWASVAPDVLARNTTQEVVRIVSKDQGIKGGNRARIDRLVEDKVLPHFDFQKMARLAVGKNWSKATPGQQEQIVKAFRTLLVRTYAGAISSVADYKIDYKPLRLQPGDTDVTVSTEVLKPGVSPVGIQYHMLKEGDDWKVYDVVVDNASLVTAYRSSFDSEVRKGGIEALIAALNHRNQSNAHAEK